MFVIATDAAGAAGAAEILPKWTSFSIRRTGIFYSKKLADSRKNILFQYLCRIELQNGTDDAMQGLELCQLLSRRLRGIFFFASRNNLSISRKNYRKRRCRTEPDQQRTRQATIAQPDILGNEIEKVPVAHHQPTAR